MLSKFINYDITDHGSFNFMTYGLMFVFLFLNASTSKIQCDFSKWHHVNHLYMIW